MREDEKERPMPQLGSTPAAPTEKPDLKRRILESKQRILSGMKGRYTGEETSRWLTSIEENPKSAEETITIGGLVDESRLSMPALLDLLFDHLQRYTFELNKVATDPDMKINCERPTNWNEKVEYLTKTRFMRGHLSTRHWSFIVYAEESKADGYFVPTDFLVGFSPGADFAPYITVQRMPSAGDDIIWGIEKKILSSVEVPRLARRLITQLVKVCTGEASSDDKFTFSSSESVVQPQASVDRSYEFELEGQNLGGGSGNKETRSQKLKRLMEDSARQEEADRAAGIGFTKRPVTVAERPTAESGVFQAPGNGHGVPSSSGTSSTTASGAFSASAPPFQGFVPPGQTALPTAPGAMGQSGVHSPGSIGQSGIHSAPGQAPGAIGQSGVLSGGPPGLLSQSGVHSGAAQPPGGFGQSGVHSAPGQPPGALGQTAPPGALGQMMPPGGLGAPGGPPPGFGMPGPPPGLNQNAPPGPPGLLQPPGGLSMGQAPSSLSGPPPGFGDGAPSNLSGPPPGFGEGAPPSLLTGGAPGGLSSERNPVVPPEPPAMRPPGALFGGGQAAERGRVNPALLPEESGMHKSMSGDSAADAPAPWANMNMSRSVTASQEMQVPSLSDVTRPPAEAAAAPEAPAPGFAAPAPPAFAQPAQEAEPEAEPAAEYTESGYEEPAYEQPAYEQPADEEEPAYEEPAAEEAASYEEPAFEETAYEELASEEPPSEEPPAPPLPPVLPAPAAPVAPPSLEGTVPSRGGGLAGLVRRTALHDSAPPSPRKDSAPAVQVDFGSADPDPPAPTPSPVPSGVKPTLQSLLQSTSDHRLPVIPAVPSNPDEITKMVDDAQKSALGNISGIIQELDKAIKSLQEAGVEAMQGGNFESVQLVMENTKRLKATKDRLNLLLDEISVI